MRGTLSREPRPPRQFCGAHEGPPTWDPPLRPARQLRPQPRGGASAGGGPAAAGGRGCPRIEPFLGAAPPDLATFARSPRTTPKTPRAKTKVGAATYHGAAARRRGRRRSERARSPARGGRRRREEAVREGARGRERARQGGGAPRPPPGSVGPSPRPAFPGPAHRPLLRPLDSRAPAAVAPSPARPAPVEAGRAAAAAGRGAPGGLAAD